MLRRIFQVLLALLVALVLYAGVGLWWAHRAIDAIDPRIPEPAELLRFDPKADLPVALSFVNTASQQMPRSSVLDPSLDPQPDARYVMSHAAFVLEWRDGRMFLIDLGMDREAALAFGAPLEWVSGAEPIEFHGSTADRLGDALARVRGLGFTHLHTDHTSGIAALCAALPGSVRMVQARLQAEQTNYTTRAGAEQLAAAPCAQRELLDGSGAIEIPGFPGLSVLAVGGHTPCSQIFVAHVRGADGVRSFVFTGDVVNQMDAIRFDLPKPGSYSRFVVPEATGRLARLRRLLQELVTLHDVAALVTHDRLALEASGLPER